MRTDERAALDREMSAARTAMDLLLLPENLPHIRGEIEALTRRMCAVLTKENNHADQ